MVSDFTGTRRIGDPVLKVEELSKSYGSKKVLVDLSLGVGEGEIVSLVAKNGGGKTTLMRIIMGIIEADRGECKLTARPWNEDACFVSDTCRRSAGSTRAWRPTSNCVISHCCAKCDGRTPTGWSGRYFRWFKQSNTPTRRLAAFLWGTSREFSWQPRSCTSLGC